MDPEIVKQHQEITKRFHASIFGPATSEFEEYKKRHKAHDMKSFMGPNTHIAPHYWVDDRITFTETIVRGYYEGRNIPFTEEDIFFTSFPKSGTTWLQMIGLHALYDCDVEKVKSLNVDLAIPTIEMPECTVQTLRDKASPKYVKTHLPYSLLPPGKCNKRYKILHVTRNPKDVAVSFYHFYKMMPTSQIIGDVKSIVNAFLNDAGKFRAS